MNAYDTTTTEQLDLARHDFLVSLAKIQNALEILRCNLGADVRPAIDDMDIITEEDAKAMKQRLSDIRHVAAKWGAPFSWMKD